jgi:hypothetical protein
VSGVPVYGLGPENKIPVWGLGAGETGVVLQGSIEIPMGQIVGELEIFAPEYTTIIGGVSPTTKVRREYVEVALAGVVELPVGGLRGKIEQEFELAGTIVLPQRPELYGVLNVGMTRQQYIAAMRELDEDIADLLEMELIR